MFLNVLAYVRTVDMALLRAMVDRGWNVWSQSGMVTDAGKRGISLRPFESQISSKEVDKARATGEELGKVKFDGKSKFLINSVDQWDKFKNDLTTPLRSHIKDCVVMSEVILKLHEKQPLDAVIVWTDATPTARALIFTAKHLGIPTFEARHGAWAHYIQGHFECESLVDTVFSTGEEDKLFLEFYGNKNDIVVTGKPQFDWPAMADKKLLRSIIKAHFKIPDDRPVIIYGTTWKHPFSYWEYQDDILLYLTSVLKAHMALQETCNPFLIIKLHPQTNLDLDKYREFCEAQGASEYAVTTGESSMMLPAADVLITHQSSLVSEAVIYHVPSIVFDYRDYNDHGMFKNRGLTFVDKPNKLAPAIAKLLLDDEYKSHIQQEMEDNTFFWVGLNDGKSSHRCCEVIEDRVESKRNYRSAHGLITAAG